FFLLCFSLLGTAKAALYKELNGTIKPVVRYYQDKKLVRELPLHLTDGDRIVDANGAEWKLSVAVQTVEERPDAQDYSLTWTLVKGKANEVAVGVEFSFTEWTSREFVFVPAIVYDGNRFNMIKIGYPPHWKDKKDWRLDMPTTTAIQPSLGKWKVKG
ncbi:hypothetical protein EZS27_039299, partial [termite gut metagenome]